MENKEFFSLFPEFRYEVFEEKIEKPLELNSHANSVVSMNALNTVREKSKLGEAGFVKHDIFSSPALVEKVCSDDILSPLCDVPMHVTYVSDHDWEKHSTFDIKNHFGTNSKVNNCCTISTIHVPSYDDMFDEYALRNSCSLACDDTKPLVYDGYDDEYNIFSTPTFEEKNSYDYNMPPVFDDYGDENNYSVESTPTTIVHVGSINSFMHVAHDRDPLCDSYVVNSIHDATESYYERGKYILKDLNNIEFPLFLLEFLKLYLFFLPMLFALRFHDLSLYKTIFHRKWFRFKYVSYLLFDALFCFKFLYSAFALSSSIAPT
jgi:hypothetical protein